MFTFGIFTTHIPYIAVVAFYAFFLLFGAEKASSGEIHSDNRHAFMADFKVTDNLNFTDGAVYGDDIFLGAKHHFGFSARYTQKKVKYKLKDDPAIYLFENGTSLSNRPPPSIG